MLAPVGLVVPAGRLHVGGNADESGEGEHIEQNFQPRRHVAPQSFGLLDLYAKAPPTSLGRRRGFVLLPLQRNPKPSSGDFVPRLKIFS